MAGNFDFRNNPCRSSFLQCSEAVQSDMIMKRIRRAELSVRLKLMSLDSFAQRAKQTTTRYAGAH